MSKLLKNLWLILPLLLIFSPFLVLIFYREDDAIKPNEVLTSEVSANADNCINFTTTNTANHNYTYSAYDYSESRYIFLNSVTSKRSSFFGKKRVLKKEAKIVGGTIADDNDYPFYVKLYYDEDHYCGGSLINPLWTLTAAHCVEFGEPGQFTLAFVNSINSSVSDIILHPAWSLGISPIYDGDFAIMRHTKLINNVSPVCLQSILSEPISENSKFKVIGQGSRSNDLIEMQQQLYQVEVTWQSCSLYPSEYISDNMFCAADIGKDSCFGDSGGPLLVKETLVQPGVVSWGEECAGDRPGVYSKVSMLSDWIPVTITHYEANFLGVEVRISE